MTFPTVTVQVAFDKRISETAADIDFTTITTANPVRQFVIKRGKSHVLDFSAQAGTAIFVFDDANGNLDPENTSSPYYDSGAGKTKVVPMRHIRIHAVDPATSSGYYLFRGFIEGWESNYGKSGLDQVAKCTAVDAFKAFSLAKGDGTVEAQEGSGQRLIDLVTMSGFPIAAASISADVTDQTVPEKKYTLDLDLLPQMQDVDTAEVGFFYCDRNGIPTFKNRGSRVAAFATKKGTFTDGSTVPSDTWSYDFVDFSRDDDDIINQADSTIYNTSTTGTQANDTTSQADYGIRSLTNTALMLTTAGTATTWNSYAINRLANPESRVRTLSWIQGADADDARWAPILGGDIGEFYEVERTTPAGTAISASVLTEQITHQVKAGKWTTTWSLSSADTGAYWILEDATWGKLGETTRLWFG